MTLFNKQKTSKAMIYDTLLIFREAIKAKGGTVIRITLDKKGNEELRNELGVSVAHTRKVFGIVVDVEKKCPTCGQSIVKETR